MPHPPVGSPAALADLCADSVRGFARLYREYGPVVEFPNGADRTVVAFGPAANHAVLSDPSLYYMIGPPGPRGSAQRLFPLGLLGLNGPQHHDHRRMLAPALSRSASLSLVPAMTRVVNAVLDTWVPNGRLDLYRAMKELSVRFAGELLFGLPEIPRPREFTATFQDWLDSYIACLFEMTLPVKAPPGSYERMLATAGQLAVHIRELVAARRETLKPDDHDMLAMLLRALDAGKITEAEVVGEVHTLLNASYQTTATALTWTLFLLHQHPDVLARFYREMDRPADGPGPTLVDRVIKESLRIAPPVVFTHRRQTRPGQLLGIDLPVNATVFLSIYVTHHMPDLFPDPERFDPDRWIDLHPSPYAYLPYAAGPRMCLGAVIATELFKVAVPAVVRRFRLEIVPGTRVDRHSSLTLGIESLPVTARPQDGRFAAAAVLGDVHEMVTLPQVVPGRVAA